MRCSPGAAARFGFAALGTVGLLLGSVTAATAAPASQPGWNVRTVQPPVPSTIEFFNTVACSSSANCVAGGFYQSKADDSVGGQMIASETAGTWTAAQPLPAPAGYTGLSVDGLACPSAGNCAAVGLDLQAGNNFSWPVADSQSAGSWDTPTQILPPANHSPNPRADLAGLSCPATGQCVAAGTYNATARHSPRPMVAVESGGGWRRAVQITLPANASRNPHIGGELDSVACTSVGNCVAIGSYTTRSPGRTEAMAAIESHGRWARARALPARAAGIYFSMSCLANGECVLVGTDGLSAASQRALAVTERHGTWGRAVRIGTSGTGAARPMASADAVSCGTSSCVVIGEGYHGQPLAVTFARGKWSRFAAVLPPASAGPKAVLGLDDVACTGSIACTAVGFLQPKGKAEQLAVARRG